jgi:hypothetical protein
MAFEEKIGLQIHDPSQRVEIVLFIRQKIRMQRALKVLAEKNKLAVDFRDVHHRTRGMTRTMKGPYDTGAESKGRFFPLQSDVDGAWLKACPILGRSGHAGVA